MPAPLRAADDSYETLRSLARGLLRTPDAFDQYTPWEAVRMGTLIRQLLEERDAWVVVPPGTRLETNASVALRHE